MTERSIRPAESTGCSVLGYFSVLVKRGRQNLSQKYPRYAMSLVMQYLHSIPRALAGSKDALFKKT
jgi:hypothetical protein